MSSTNVASLYIIHTDSLYQFILYIYYTYCTLHIHTSLLTVTCIAGHSDILQKVTVTYFTGHCDILHKSQ